MNEEKIISVTPISKEENLYCKMVRTLKSTGEEYYHYYPIVAMVTVEYDSYDGKTQEIRYARYDSYIEYHSLADEELVGRVDKENKTFEVFNFPIEYDDQYEDGLIFPYILLDSVDCISCDKFGNRLKEVE